jgi:Tfp pilus assembly protein PilO
MRFVAVAVGTVLVVVAWFTLLYRPGSADLKEIRAQIETTETEIAALETKLAQLQELQRNEKQLREQAAKFARALPRLPELSTYIRQVQKIADESDIAWVSVSPATPATGAAGGAAGAQTTGAVRTINVTLAASGDFFDIEGFIQRFERLDRAIRINTFSLGGEPPDPLNLSLGITMYMGGTTPESLAAVPSPAPGASPARPGASPAAGDVTDRTSQGVNTPSQ